MLAQNNISECASDAYTTYYRVIMMLELVLRGYVITYFCTRYPDFASITCNTCSRARAAFPPADRRRADSRTFSRRKSISHTFLAVGRSADRNTSRLFACVATCNANSPHEAAIKPHRHYRYCGVVQNNECNCTMHYHAECVSSVRDRA